MNIIFVWLHVILQSVIKKSFGKSVFVHLRFAFAD